MKAELQQLYCGFNEFSVAILGGGRKLDLHENSDLNSKSHNKLHNRTGRFTTMRVVSID